MTREIEPVSTDPSGDETHPAFGVAGVVRREGTPRALFQSDLMHSSTVVLSVRAATRLRDLNRDWIHPAAELIEIEMSETQWGALVSSTGKGSGVPITIRRRENHVTVPSIPYEPRTSVARAEAQSVVARLLEEAKEAMKALDAAEDNKLGVKERRAARGRLRAALSNAASNAQFAVDSLTEATESLVNQAKADIETHVMAAAAGYGIAAPVAFPALELGAAEEPQGATGD